MPKRIKTIEEALSKNKKNGDCIEYTGRIDARGYGVFKISKICYLAHRASYQKTFGEIAEGLLICHKCDNRKCINPNHLYSGTYADNARDRYKGVTKKKISNKIYGDMANINVRVKKDIHKEVLNICYEKKISIKEYILTLIINERERENGNTKLG